MDPLFFFFQPCLQDIRYFFASLVGMLREKSGGVQELHAVVQASLRERLELTRQGRVDEQEDALFRLKEVGACMCCLLTVKISDVL
jgi:hypothetical protein